MILLIDGYNLIKIAYSKNFISEKLRNEFINKLNNYSKKKKNKIVIIFDGGNFNFPVQEKFKQVTIMYSGFNRSADEVIKNYILENKNKELFLVSSDNELQKFASSNNVQFLKSQEFYRLIGNKTENEENIIKQNDTLYKTSNVDIKELDLLMKQIDNIAIKKEDDIIQSKHKISYKHSKKEKKRLQKIKKL